MEDSKRSTEELILEAAQAVFLEKGLAGARMQEIADRAGINKALLHYYFRSKEKLSELIINRAISVLLPRVMGILETDQDQTVAVQLCLCTVRHCAPASQAKHLPVPLARLPNIRHMEGERSKYASHPLISPCRPVAPPSTSSSTEYRPLPFTITPAARPSRSRKYS